MATYTLTATGGTYEIPVGTAAALRVSRTLTPDSGVLAETGTSALLTRQRGALIGAEGSYLLFGTPAGLTYAGPAHYFMSAAGGVSLHTGSPVDLIYFHGGIHPPSLGLNVAAALHHTLKQGTS